MPKNRVVFVTVCSFDIDIPHCLHWLKFSVTTNTTLIERGVWKREGNGLEMTGSGTRTEKKASTSRGNLAKARSKSMRLEHVLRSRQHVASSVYGREREMKTLQEAFDRAADPQKPSFELVVIRGPSGCGKSFLVKELMEWVREERPDVDVQYGQGKYDLLTNNEPFAAIAEASNDLCQEVRNHGKIPKFQAALRDAASEQERIGMLVNAIPGLQEILGKETRQEQYFSTLSQAFTRFKQLWRTLLQAFSTSSDVTVLFIDDVQWADTGSIDLIQSLKALGASKARRILVICAYRDDEHLEKGTRDRLHWCFSLGHGDKQESKEMENESEKETKGGETIVIELSNLDKNGTAAMVNGLLFGPHAEIKEKTRELSDAVYAHTGGNAFFAVHYLDFLTSEDILQTTDLGLSWQWDMTKITDKDSMPRTVGELLSKIISRLPLNAQHMLITAAHIGHQFSSKVLEREDLYVLKSDEGSVRKPTSSWRDRKYYASNALYRDEVRKVLDEAVEEGLVVRKGKRVFQFPHDQIQKALYSMLSEKPKEQELLHYKIGWTVHNLVSASEIPDNAPSLAFTKDEESRGEAGNLFMAVDNLNLGASYIACAEERMQVIQLNYGASQMALQKSALVGAVKYVRSAISLLEEDSWTNHYNVCLSLYSLAAKLEHSTGNYVRSSIFIREIHDNGRSVVDRLPAFFAEIDVLGSRGDLQAALHLGLAVLSRLGVRIPERPNVIHVLRELMRSSRLMKKCKRTGFVNLPTMKDPIKKAAMEVLASMWLYSFMLGSKFEKMFAVVGLRMASMSCQYGLSEHAPYALVAFASIENTLGKFEAAYETAKIGVQLLDTIDGAYDLASRTWLPAFSIIVPWAGQPLEDARSNFLRSYHVGVSLGDLEFAYLSGICNVGSSYFIGDSPLDVLKADLERYIMEMEEFQVNIPKWIALSMWEPLRALVGKYGEDEAHTVDITLLNEMKAEQNENVLLTRGTNQVAANLVMSSIGRSESLEEDRKLVHMIESNLAAVHNHFSVIYSAFVLAIACFDLVSNTNLKQYRKKGRKLARRMEGWHKKGAVCAGPLALFLKAECARDSMLKKGKAMSSSEASAVEKAYLDAVKASQERGSICIYVEALSYERLAELMDEKETTVYLAKATETYSRWGAQAKVDRLRIKIYGTDET